MGSHPVLGIDLGTSFCCAAIYRNHEVEIVANKIGKRVTPSVVAFDGRNWLVGEAASVCGARDPERCIFEVKRLMGRSFQDPKLTQLKGMWPFEVVAAPSGAVLIKVPGVPGKEVFEPEEISAMLLKEMKKIAEAYLDDITIKDAVITVPAYFSDSQREATKKAGILAGLNVLRLMNEPTAAAVAYGHQRVIAKSSVGKKIMVFDLGGGTLDVSIIAVKEGAKEECDFEVRAVEGESHLGGADFDNRLMRHVAEEHQRETKSKDSILDDRHIRPVLKAAVVAAKHSLSFDEEADIDIESRKLELFMSIGRATFESLNEDLFRRCVAVIEKVLRDAGIRKSEITEVVLAGGSTRIPRVKELLTSFFDGRKPLQTVHPDEVVAYGAAVQAGLLAPGLRNEDRPTIAVEDITSLSIGLRSCLDGMTVLIPKGSRIPATGSIGFYLTKDYQSDIGFKLYEGERAFCRHNRYLGEFVQEGFLPSLADGKSVTEVALEVNYDGIVCATAEATANHREVGSRVRYQGVLRKDDALAAALPEELGEGWEAREEAVRACFNSRKKLQLLAWEIREKQSYLMSEEQKGKVREVLTWLDSEVGLASSSVYLSKVVSLTLLKNEVNAIALRRTYSSYSSSSRSYSYTPVVQRPTLPTVGAPPAERR